MDNKFKNVVFGSFENVSTVLIVQIIVTVLNFLKNSFTQNGPEKGQQHVTKIYTHAWDKERKDEKDNGGRLQNHSHHADVDENAEDYEQDNHILEFTMKELLIAMESPQTREIGRLQRKRSGRSQRS